MKNGKDRKCSRRGGSFFHGIGRFIPWCIILLLMSGGAAALEPEETGPEKAADEEAFVPSDENGDPEKAIESFFAIYEPGRHQQYGYALFERTKAPPPYTPGPDYILGPDDEIMVKIWGESLRQFNMASQNDPGDYLERSLTVDADGTVTFPEIGVLSLGGVSLGAAERLITKTFQDIYKDCSVILALKKARKLTLLMVGKVFNPGPVEVTAGSSLYDALMASGGVSRRGSLRNILLKHPDGSTDAFDFYDLLIGGKIDAIPRIRDRDAIYVGSVGPVVLVTGRVRHSAIYEVREQDLLSDVIRYAGGLLPDTDRGAIEVRRFESDGRKILSLTDSDLNTPVQDGDVIHFTRRDAEIRNAIVLTGHVRVGKTVGWREGLRLGDVLKSYDQLKKNAALAYAEIKRFQDPNLQKSILTFHPAKLLDGDGEENILLRPHDEIRIFSRGEIQRRPMVKISGLVRKPGRYRWIHGLKLTSLISKAGGVLGGAADEVRVFRRRRENGAWRISTLEASLEAIAADSSKDAFLEPLDRVMIHQQNDFNQTEWEAAVEGEVKFPGVHPIDKSTRLADVIRRAGGLTPDAWPPGLIFRRVAAENVQSRVQTSVIDLLKKDLALQTAQLTSPHLNEEERLEKKQSVSIIQNYLAHLEARAPRGRIVLDPGDVISLETLEKSNSNLNLQHGDYIFIPGKPRFISIVGEVFRPSSYLYTEGKKLGEYLAMAGGVSAYADLSSAFLLRAGGRIVSYQQKRETFMDVVLEPGDALALPSRILRATPPGDE
ncbi:MAG: hypothetical protein GY859_43410 [Desulfobacterales bacterium]|nr:hypothetical protein [Desulfobacterales bacterium]